MAVDSDISEIWLLFPGTVPEAVVKVATEDFRKRGVEPVIAGGPWSAAPVEGFVSGPVQDFIGTLVIDLRGPLAFAAQALAYLLLMKFADKFLDRVVDGVLDKIPWRPACVAFMKKAFADRKGWTIQFTLRSGDRIDSLTQSAKEAATLVDERFPDDAWLVEYHLDRQSGDWDIVATCSGPGGPFWRLWEKDAHKWRILDGLEHHALNERLQARCRTKRIRKMPV